MLSPPTPEIKRKPIVVRIVVWEVKADKIIRDFKVNLAASDKHRWLTRIVIWAMLNGKSVEIININDDT